MRNRSSMTHALGTGMAVPLVGVLLASWAGTEKGLAARTEADKAGRWVDAAWATGTEKKAPNQEECYLDPQCEALPKGVMAGDQIRVYRHDDSDFALFTVRLRKDEKGTSRILLAEEGLKRLGYGRSDSLKLRLELPAVQAAMNEAQARRQGEMIEILESSSPAALRERKLLLLVPHGGAIETGTDKVARRLLTSAKGGNSAVLWGCLGFRKGGGAYARWHVTSTDISERSFPKLGELAKPRKPFRCALAIHGHSGKEIFIGGQGSAALKQRIKTTLDALDLGAEVKILDSDDPLAGHASTNIVNRYTRNGIQLELPLSVRRDNGTKLSHSQAAFGQKWA